MVFLLIFRDLFKMIENSAIKKSTTKTLSHSFVDFEAIFGPYDPAQSRCFICTRNQTRRDSGRFYWKVCLNEYTFIRQVQ